MKYMEMTLDENCYVQNLKMLIFFLTHLKD
jgi:hypothetical protein